MLRNSFLMLSYSTIRSVIMSLSIREKPPRETCLSPWPKVISSKLEPTFFCLPSKFKKDTAKNSKSLSQQGLSISLHIFAKEKQ